VHPAREPWSGGTGTFRGRPARSCDLAFVDGKRSREEFEQIVRRLSHDEQQACITALEAFSSAASDTTSSLGKTEGDAFTNVLLADQED
jgi:hypothetical protein